MSFLVPANRSLTRATTNTRAAEQACLSLLHLCKSLSHLRQLHSYILKLGLRSNTLVLTKFASTSSSLHSIDYASHLLFASDADHRLYDAFLYNTLIRAFAQTHRSNRGAIDSYRLMLDQGVFPNKFTYPFVLKAVAGLAELDLGRQVHGSVLKFGFGGDLHVGNTMVHMYGCCDGGFETARKVFDKMPQRDSVSWSAMIGGCVRMGLSCDAVELFREMQVNGVQPDEITMISVLSACTDLGALDLGKWVESYIHKQMFNKSIELCNAMIDMFAKCGDLDRALNVFRSMSERNLVSWTSMIVGLAMHGRGVEAISLFEEMRVVGIEPDDVVFIGLLTACSHGGLVEQGRSYFDLMMKAYGIVPRIEHYGCMVDLLCRVGLLEDALDFIKTMPVEPNPVIWRTLVNACRSQGEFKLSETIMKRLIGDEPGRDSNYVLLSNIYARMSSWDKKYGVREVMNKKGMKKTPGSTMVEVDGKIHEFVAGDMAHEDCEKIYEMLDEMGVKMKKAGYIPITSEVLLDIDEGDKEDALNRHSEKLAIAFALLRVPPGLPIRLVKNLRVCKDCHAAMKHVSKIYDREIVMRDRTRFHHFNDGLCSCEDFW